MAFDGTLAGRIRDVLARKKGIEEKKMFGCICFFLNGNALAGVWEGLLIARLGPGEGEAAMREPHACTNTKPKLTMMIGYRIIQIRLMVEGAGVQVGFANESYHSIHVMFTSLKSFKAEDRPYH